MPFVLSITSGIPRAFAAANMSRICGWIEGSPPDSCTASGCPSAATNASSIDSTCASESE
jgi:hypothetical protein